MGNPDKEMVDVPVSAIESAHNVETATAEVPAKATATATESELNAAPAPEPSATEATRSLEDPLAITPSTAPPTYEEYVPSYNKKGKSINFSSTQKEVVSMPASAMTMHEDPIEATRTTQPTYPSYDEKVAMSTQVPPTDPRLTPLDKLGEDPKWMTCPFCQQNAMTRVNKESTSSTS
jgi:lipopolysaccharide-induced tumor necrosis factor-alpha factor